MVGRPPAAVLPGGWIERLEPSLGVEIVDRIRDEPFETIFFDPVRDRLRQEMLLFLIGNEKIIRHGWILVSTSDSS